jgi:uncharacterized protein (TIGR03435 family)
MKTKLLVAQKLPFAAACLAITVVAGVEAQAPTFEVAAIRSHPGEVTFSSDPSIRGSRVTGTACTLLDMITTAYDVRYDQISGGPAWVGTERYDLEAKAGGDGQPTQDQMRMMLQNLLAERFQLKLHRDTKEVPIYALVVGRNGPKLTPSAPNATGGSTVRGSDKGLQMVAKRGTMLSLANQLSVSSGRPVIDKTNLTETFEFTLEWFPANRTPPPDADVAPDLFNAIQNQLGLRLESTKGPIEVLVIDSVEKASAN